MGRCERLPQRRKKIFLTCRCVRTTTTLIDAKSGDQAMRIIKEGRAGAEQEYDVAEDEVTAKTSDRANTCRLRWRQAGKKERELKEANRDTSEKPSDQVSIAGAWTAGGNKLRVCDHAEWHEPLAGRSPIQPSLSETAKGEFTGKDSIKATWTNRNGSASANGRITSDANGNAIRIDWSMGLFLHACS